MERLLNLAPISQSNTFFLSIKGQSYRGFNFNSIQNIGAVFNWGRMGGGWENSYGGSISRGSIVYEVLLNEQTAAEKLQCIGKVVVWKFEWLFFCQNVFECFVTNATLRCSTLCEGYIIFQNCVWQFYKINMIGTADLLDKW